VIILAFCNECGKDVSYDEDGSQEELDCLFVPYFGWICGECLDKLYEESLMKQERVSIEEYFLRMAQVAAIRGTCPRRRAGCVLVDENNKLLSTGYNGNPSGHTHCIDVPCPGALAPSGEGLELCEAIHAEINAIAQCIDPRTIHTCYTTTSPCIHCVKSLLATNCKRIVFLEAYPHTEAKILWEKSNREWIVHSPLNSLNWS